MRTRAIAAIVSLFTTLTAPAQAPDSYARRQSLFEQLADSQLVRLAGPDIGRRPPARARLVCTMIVRTSGLAFALLFMSGVPGLAQGSAVSRQSQLSLDIGVLELGISYARRIGQGPFSIGGGLRGAWEPWNTFEQSVFEPLGGELFVRMLASRNTQVETARRSCGIARPTTAPGAPALLPAFTLRRWSGAGVSGSARLLVMEW